MNVFNGGFRLNEGTCILLMVNFQQLIRILTRHTNPRLDTINQATFFARMSLSLGFSLTAKLHCYLLTCHCHAIQIERHIKFWS